jgi:hypothetical protein
VKSGAVARGEMEPSAELQAFNTQITLKTVLGISYSCFLYFRIGLLVWNLDNSARFKMNL